MAIWKRLKRQSGVYLRNRRAATAIEYGLLIALLVLAIIGAVGQTSNSAASNYNTVINLYPDLTAN